MSTNTLAATKAASRKPAARSTGCKLNAADFEAPLTVTIEGRTAAVLRFSAFLNGRTPEEEARECVRTDMLTDLVDGFGFHEGHAEDWLAGK